MPILNLQKTLRESISQAILRYIEFNIYIYRDHSQKIYNICLRYMTYDLEFILRVESILLHLCRSIVYRALRE